MLSEICTCLSARETVLPILPANNCPTHGLYVSSCNFAGFNNSWFSHSKEMKIGVDYVNFRNHSDETHDSIFIEEHFVKTIMFGNLGLWGVGLSVKVLIPFC